jgi:cell division septal protein FtsQ
VNPTIKNKNLKKNFFSRRKKEKEKYNFGVTSTYIALLSLISLLLLYYVWILNVNATKGYNIRELEIEKKTLLMEKELLDVKIAELESLSTILQDDDLQNMEKIWEPDYLVIKDNVQYVYND